MTPIIKRDRVRLAEGQPAPGAGADAGAGQPARGRHAKEVELVRIDGEVRAIELRCRCGEVSVIELSYEPQPTEGGDR